MVDKYTQSRDGLKWTFTLREGLRFHDGQPVTPEDCVASIVRCGARIRSVSSCSPRPGSSATDKKTFVLELKEPFGLVLEALGKPSSKCPLSCRRVWPPPLPTSRSRSRSGPDPSSSSRRNGNRGTRWCMRAMPSMFRGASRRAVPPAASTFTLTAWSGGTCPTRRRRRTRSRPGSSTTGRSRPPTS